MRSPVILDHLQQALIECLHGDKGVTLKEEENKVTVQLLFNVKNAICQYNIEMSLMSADKVRIFSIFLFNKLFMSDAPILPFKNK